LVKKLVHMIDPALPTPVKFVRQYKTRKVIYDVELEQTQASQAIRDAYGQFWRQCSGRRLPEGLKGISFANASTFSTRVRVRLLKEISRKHQAVNPNVSCYVTNYLARPELKVHKRRGPLNSYTYSQAIQKFPQHLSLEFLHDLYLYAKTSLPEREVVERFLILTPDLFDMPPQQPNPTEDESMVVDESQNPQAIAAPINPVPLSQGDLLQSFGSPSTTQQLPATSSLVTVTPPAATFPAQIQTPFEIANLGASDDFTVVQKRNQNRFAKKSTPYPTQ
jgi:hypothetical protein